MSPIEQNNYLDQLNIQQRNAVEYIDGPSLVIAGAGSGKTRVLTYKIVHLLNNGFEPFRIMALTFTNKAAREMKERIATAVGDKIASRIWMGTFHSIFLRILRSHSDILGFNKNFTIYDASDSKSLIKSIIKDLELDDKTYKPNTIASIISNAKNALVSAKQYSLDKDYQESDKRAKREKTALIYKIYCERCKLADAMDFDDILYFMNLLLRDNPDIKRHYQEFFKYILVDEYQDTNFAQHLIISQLCDKNLCVVGDDAQSIYSFRGANIANILNLQNHYPNLKIFKLEQNYRSTQNIINAANSLIEKNVNQIKKNIFSNNSIGRKLKIIGTFSDIEESFIVANDISKSKMTLHDSYDDYAILYRTNAQSRVLEESLRKRNIPYLIYGGLSFYQRKEIKDAICYFRMAINPHDDEALRRIINYPTRGIGDTTIKKIQSAAIANNVSMWSVISDNSKYNLTVNSGTQKKLSAFAEIINEFINDNNNGSNAFELAQLVYNRTGLLSSIINDNTPETISKQENLKELLSGINEFVQQQIESGENDLSMTKFISETSLATDQDEQTSDEPKVTLMTVHAAKGLEFKHIHIVGVEEDLFPSALSAGSASEIEEERRLLYVAITRAKEFCTISYSKSRFRNGQTVSTRMSRFINEIDFRYKDQQSSNSFDDRFFNPVAQYNSNSERLYNNSSSYNRNTSSLHSNLKRLHQSASSSDSLINNAPVSNSDKNISVGTNIRHSRFGEGMIKSIDNSSGDTIIIVDFKNVGEKKLLLKFAKFEII